MGKKAWYKWKKKTRFRVLNKIIKLKNISKKQIIDWVLWL